MYWSHNELTRYRYEVVLHKCGAELHSSDHAPVLAWGRDISQLSYIAHHLAEDKPAELRLSGIPNERIAGECNIVWDLWGFLMACWKLTTADEDLLNGLAAEDNTHGVDPEACFDLGERLGYFATVTWSRAGDLTAASTSSIRTRILSAIDIKWAIMSQRTAIGNPCLLMATILIPRSIQNVYQNELHLYLVEQLPRLHGASGYRVWEALPAHT